MFSPEDVATAAKILSDDDEDVTAELVDPFASAAKQGRAIFGRWG